MNDAQIALAHEIASGSIDAIVTGNIEPLTHYAPRAVADELAAALELALKYWADRQQRYKNRHPVWVGASNIALTKYRKAEK